MRRRGYTLGISRRTMLLYIRIYQVMQGPIQQSRVLWESRGGSGKMGGEERRGEERRGEERRGEERRGEERRGEERRGEERRGEERRERRGEKRG
jgi:hypothetical protein